LSRITPVASVVDFVIIDMSSVVENHASCLSCRLCHYRLCLVNVFQATSSVASEALLINSVVGDCVCIGSGTVIVHCSLERPLKVGDSSAISGLRDSDVLVSRSFSHAIH